MAAKNLMTYEGLKALENELEDRKVRVRREIAEKIKEARAQGDLSENAEYDAARDEQRDNEERIAEVEKILKNAEVDLGDATEDGAVGLGCKVKVLDVEYNEEEEFRIVGATEANSLENLISNESPIGSGIMGKKVGDIVDIEAPAGVIQYKILEVIPAGEL